MSNNVETLQSTRVNEAMDVWLDSSVNETRKASVALSLNNDSTLCGTYWRIVGTVVVFFLKK